MAYGPIHEPKQRRKSPGAPLGLSYFEERSIPEPNTGCWIWLGAISARNGYGAIKNGGRTRRAHRTCLEVVKGTTYPSDLDVCHRCDLRCCVNPDHLFVGTRADNMRDCISKDRFSPIPILMGEESPNSKLTEADVRAIRADHRSQRKIAASYGVDKGTIACIQRRMTWRHI